MPRQYRSFYFLVMISFLSGCGTRITDWAKDMVNQGTTLPDWVVSVRPFVKSVSLYDQFDTVAMFDALWLADPVKIVYSEVYARKHGKSNEQYDVFVRRQLAENEHYILFYVLSLYDISLREKESSWSMFLEIDDQRFTPVEIKTIEIAPEYKAMFGDCFTRFKVPYQVKFTARDIESMSHITSETKMISLVFRSVDKEVRLTWNLDELLRDSKQEVNEEDCGC